MTDILINSILPLNPAYKTAIANQQAAVNALTEAKPLGAIVNIEDTYRLPTDKPDLGRVLTVNYVAAPTAPAPATEKSSESAVKASKLQSLKNFIGTKCTNAKDVVNKGLAAVKAGIVTGYQNAKAGLVRLYTSTKTTASKVRLPGVPKVSLPKVSFPKVSLPKVSLPKVSLPKVSLPKISLPTLSMPSYAGIKSYLTGNKTKTVDVDASIASVASTETK